mgnify:CR=1 FL=1
MTFKFHSSWYLFKYCGITEKIDMLEFADIVAINKFDKRGAQDALRDVKKQYQRNRNLWNVDPEQMPVFGSIASQFNDPGTNELYKAIIQKIIEKSNLNWQSTLNLRIGNSEKIYIIPPGRVRYLSDITKTNRDYDTWVKEQSEIAQDLYALHRVAKLQGFKNLEALEENIQQKQLKLHPECKQILDNWEKTKPDLIYIIELGLQKEKELSENAEVAGELYPIVMELKKELEKLSSK